MEKVAVISHNDFVMSNAREVDHAAVAPVIARSWHRSLDVHRLDPGRAAAPRVLTGGLLRDHQDPMESLLQIAKGGVENLFAQVRDAGYVVLLTDVHGVTVDFQTNPMTQRDLRRAGLYMGSCWSESEEGTCAVGTCIIDSSPITVHQSEHFRVTNTALTCSAAPVMDTDGKLLAILDASALSSPDDKRSQTLVLQLVSATARMIENAYFLKKFQDYWVIRLSKRREFAEVLTEGLIALDQQGKIIAVNRNVTEEVRGPGLTWIGNMLDEVFDTRLDTLLAESMAHFHQPVALRALHSSRQYYAVMRSPCGRVAQSTSVALKISKTRTSMPRTILTLEDLAGDDPQMLKSVSTILRVIDKGIAIMLQGETGTGKEAFANAIHQASNRAGKPFVALNCAAIPESLIESELFGYADGAFTGARSAGMRGKIVQAHGGTLFLDEIGDMPLQLQTRLLRVLAEKEILPLGTEKAIPVDVQIVCATHRNLLDLVVEARFREDLYYRLNGIKINLTALRHRTDKSAVIHHVLAFVAREANRGQVTMAPHALDALLGYAWPGNLRQLTNVLRAALALNDDDRITLDDIPADIDSPARQDMLSATPFVFHAAHPKPPVATPHVPSRHGNDAETQECNVLLEALKASKWNVTRAADALGICRATVYRRMTRYQIIEPNGRD